jgi:hypothetical protein
MLMHFPPSSYHSTFMKISIGRNEIRRVPEHFLLMYGSMLKASLPEWMNIIFFPLFRHPPPKTGRLRPGLRLAQPGGPNR